MRVLIAEDDPISRKVLEAHLLKWGYEVLVAEDGDQAWSILSRGSAPGIAILDWMMPGMDGVELCRRIRGSDNDAFTYVIMLSAKNATEDIVEALEAGADDYVTKPGNPLELRARIQAAERVVNLEVFLRNKVRELERVALERDELKRQMSAVAELD